MSSRRWVVNASPLILLAKIGRLDLLELLAPSIVVPQSVIREIEAGAGSDISSAVTVSWAKARAVADAALTAPVASWDLGAGESQVITHSLAEPSVCVLDDGQARACAQALGLPLIGTLGIALRARKQDLIPLARPLIEQILAVGSHLSRQLVEQALNEVGE